jgi:hypothetical protein
MKRIIKVTATYDLSDPRFKQFQITPKERVKEMIEKDVIHVFSGEAFRGVEVEVIDE